MNFKNQKILLGTILNNMPGPVYTKSLNGNYLFINKGIYLLQFLQ